MDHVRLSPDTFDEDSATAVTASRIGDLDFVLDPARQAGPMDDSRSTVLEVHQTWRDTVIDTIHARSGTVTAGSTTGFRWKLMGQDLAWVPKPLARVLPFVPPMLSEVEPQNRADLHVPHATLDGRAPTPLFSEQGGVWTALVRDGWQACLRDDDGVHDLDDLISQGRAQAAGDGYRVDLQDGDHLALAFDEVQVHARPVPASKRVASPVLDSVDPFFLGLLAMSGMLAACFGLVVLALPGGPESSFHDLAEHVAEMAPTIIEDEPDTKKIAEGSIKSPAKAKRAEGARPDSKRLDQPERMASASALQQERDMVMHSGVLGALQDAGIASGMGGEIETGLLDGLQVITGKGVAGGRGLGDRLSGLGGGGVTDGIGGIGPGCVPGQPCSQYGLPGGTGRMGGKRIGVLSDPKQPPVMIGSIDRADIERVIKRNITKFRYCYQRQLNRDPHLSGKVVNRFVIAGDGSVSKSETKSSTVSPEVDKCVARTMQRLSFEPPKGGGIAIVSYPFMFSYE